jgi:hypothetical protein
MLLRSIFVLVALFCCYAVANDEKLPPWTPIDWRTLPPANADDQVAVYYLASPLLEEDFGDWLEYLDCYHGALGFQNLRTNFTITINYDANDFFRNSLFPKIVQQNGQTELVWINQGANFIYLGINESYWVAGQIVVSTITGTMYNDFISGWNSQVNNTYQFYNMFSVLYSYSSDAWLPSWDCWDFMWASFYILGDMGAQFDQNLQLNRNYANIYSSVPPVNYTALFEEDPQVKQDIIDFYEFTQAAFEDLSFFEFWKTLLEVFEGDFYIRYSDEYWQAQLHWPYFAVDWDYAPLPGQNQHPKK